MKRATYLSAVACCLLAFTGCAQTPKRVVPPDAAGTAGQPAQYGIPSGTVTTQPEGAAPTPRYLDVTDDTGLTPEKVGADTLAPSMEYLNNRVYEYGRKLDRWKELDKQSLSANLNQAETEKMVNCFKQLQQIQGRYATMQEALLQSGGVAGTGEVSGADILALQYSDIEFLEGPCGQLLSTTEQPAPALAPKEKGSDFSQLEAGIERYTANKQYEEVVQAWLQVPPEQVERVGLQTRLRYGNALMYLHQEEQAAKVYQQIVDQMSTSAEQPTDLMSMRKTLADLYTASGNYPAAQDQYKKISQDYAMLANAEEWSKEQLAILENSAAGSPELTEYSGLLRNYLGFIPEKDGYKVVWQAEEFLHNYPYSPVAANVGTIKTRAKTQADAWMNDFLEKVDQLVAEKKYQEAIAMVDNAPVDLMDEEKRNALKAKKDDFAIAEAVERETTKLAGAQELQRKWNSGMLLVKAERFEEANALFTEMLGTEYDAKAKEKISEISQLAAQDERRKAADLFIRFTKTADPESKKKLLVESHRILQDILVKYPNVDIADKVRGNIQRVEQEMNALDPTLLQSAGANPSAEQPQEVDAFDINSGSQPSQPVQVLPPSQLPIIVQPPSQ